MAGFTSKSVCITLGAIKNDLYDVFSLIYKKYSTPPKPLIAFAVKSL